MNADELLRKVARREWLRRFAGRFTTGSLVAAAFYLVALIVQRTTNLFPDIFPWLSLVAIPAVGVVYALATTRAPSRQKAARLVDRESGGARDLFLSYTTLDSAEGEYRPIVTEKAEATATGVVPSRIVPFRWTRGFARLAMAGLLLALGLQFLPRLDPFKKNIARERETRERERIAEIRKLVTLRKEQLAREKESAAIEEALGELEKTFRIAKPEMRQANLKKLEDHQKEIGEMWRQLNSEKLKKSLDADTMKQKFGAPDTEMAKRIEEALKKGEVAEVKKALAAMKKEAAELAKAPDSAETRERQASLSKQLQTLADAVAKSVESKPLADSLSRALEQLAMAQKSELSEEALSAMAQSLDLSQQELESLAQSMSDLKDLEDALRSLQAAKQLNADGKLDGKECASCNSIADYAALYEKMLADAKGRGAGMGMRGPGTGKGGVAPEDESSKTDFTTEQTKGLLAGGKLLLEWKTSEVSQSGDTRTDYSAPIDAVKEGVGEAILQEQVPPGYHEGIRGYFDSLESPTGK